jgi:hypothetical protein
MTAQRRFSWAILNSLGLAFGIVVFLVAASGALPSVVVHADGALPLCSSGASVPCTLGPNLEIVAASDTNNFPGTCDNGSQGYNNSATNPVYTQAITGCGGISFNGTASLVTNSVSLAGLNGHEIEDYGASIYCGVTGGDSVALTFGALTLNCPSESTAGTAALVSGETTFAPVLDATGTLTVSVTGVSGGTFSVGGYTESISLTSTPEPSTLLMLASGLLALLGAAKFKALAA